MAEVQYGGGGIVFFLVEKVQGKEKIGRKLSSYENNGPIDTNKGSIKRMKITGLGHIIAEFFIPD